MTEEWRDVPGYEGRYQVSDLGRVRSVSREVVYVDGRSRFCVGKVLKHHQSHGYPRVNLGYMTPRLVHQIVMLAFSGSCPAGYEIAHGDGDPANPVLRNLRYATHADNMLDMLAHGTAPRGDAHGRRKLSSSDVAQIRKIGRSELQRVIAARFGVTRSTISYVLAAKVWAHI